MIKLVTFDPGSGPRPGVMAGEAVVLDLVAGLAIEDHGGCTPGCLRDAAGRYGGDMIGLIERAEQALPAVRRLLQDHALRARLVDGICRREQADLRWDRVAEATLDVYRQAMRAPTK